MEFIDINCQEHRALIIKAIKDKNVYLIQQLNDVAETGCTRIVVLDTSYDPYRYSTNKMEESVYEVISDERALDFFFRLQGEIGSI